MYCKTCKYDNKGICKLEIADYCPFNSRFPIDPSIGDLAKLFFVIIKKLTDLNKSLKRIK